MPVGRVNGVSRVRQSIQIAKLEVNSFHHPQLGSGTLRIPKGFRPEAQGCSPREIIVAECGGCGSTLISRGEGRATLGWLGQNVSPPTGLWLPVSVPGRNPVGVDGRLPRPSQGSSCLPPPLRDGAARATLGWRTQSLWDWPKSRSDLWVTARASGAFGGMARVTKAAGA